MKKYLSILFLTSLLFACEDKLELTASEPVAPGIDKPTAAAAAVSVTVITESALKSAVAAAAPGDIITISGTINLTSTLQLLNSGTSSAKINITGGTLNCSGISSGWGVKVNGSYWNISNMVIKNSPDAGLVFQYGGYNWVNNVTTTGNKDTGIQIYNGAHHNSINNCISYGNNDPATGGENADGFACKLSGGQSNQFNNCNAYNNADDGYDLYGQTYPVYITGCAGNSNGGGANGDGNGFKLGSSGLSVAHRVTNCSASNNSPGWGFTRNGNAKGVIVYSGLTGSGNAAGFSDL